MNKYEIKHFPDDLEPLFNETETSTRRAEREAIRTAYAVGDYSQLEENVTNYIAKYSAAGLLHEQFYLYYEVELAWWREEETAHICRLAERALELTKPLDAIPNCREKKYTYVELKLLLTLIECGHKSWKEFGKSEICLLKIIQYARLYFMAVRCKNIENRAWQILLAGPDNDANLSQL